MPTCLEHWVTMPPTTCYGYKRRYHDVETLKKQIIIHGKNAGVIIADNNNGPVLLIDDFIKVSPKILSQKRPRIEEHNVPVVKLVPLMAQTPVNVVDNTEQPMAQVLMQEADAVPVQAQALALVQEPDAATVPMVQFEQPMAQAQVPMQEAYATLVQAQAPISLPHCTNTNGAEIIEFVLKLLNGADFIVPVRRDGYVNVTKICQAAGKRLQHYKDRAENKHFLDRFVVLTRIQASTLFEANEGNCANRGTFAHPDIAIHIAQWCSADFSIQVSRWVRQLMTTGRVELGNEMNVQQLEDAWRRINEELQAKASADVSAAQDLCREIILQKNELELRLATIQDAQKLTKAAQEELMAIKAREDLEAAIQFQVNTMAPRIATYKEGDNVLYLARIDETKFKYGHTKNLKQRLEAHGRRGVYPTLELVWIVKSNNGVASEDQLHAYVKKKKIIAEYGTQREIISLESVDDLERMLKKMNKCALPRADADIDIRRMEEETKRMEIIEKTKQMEINAKTKQMEINPKTMLMQMLANKTITFEQYLQIKD